MKLTNSFVISSRGSKVDPYTRSTYSNKRSEGRVYRSAVTSHSDFWQTAAPQHAAVLFRHRRRSLCSSARVKAASDGASAGFLAERERRCILSSKDFSFDTPRAWEYTPRHSMEKYHRTAKYAPGSSARTMYFLFPIFPAPLHRRKKRRESIFSPVETLTKRNTTRN